MCRGVVSVMSSKYGSHELAQQGLKWLKAQRQTLIDLYQNELLSIPFYRQIEESLRSELAAGSIDRIIKRMEGSGFDANELKASLSGVLERGVGLQPMLDASDKLVEVITRQVNRQLSAADQRPLAEALLKKVQYLNQLSKATMASALIRYESEK
jgi:cob(I)alamin adenosyltransferase